MLNINYAHIALIMTILNFDTVSHSIPLKKLHAYGIRGNMLKLCTSYLDGRSQYV